MKRYFSSESVTEGHPDKVCDLISDAVLDAILEVDANPRVACETTVSKGLVHVMGEITVHANVDIEKVVRDTIREIGYVGIPGFDADDCAVIVTLNSQSPDIALGVNNPAVLNTKQTIKGLPEIPDDTNIGAGDQGMMFGYACDETEEYMPMAIVMAHRLTKQLAYVRKNEIIHYLRPDGKSQVTVEYKGDKPKRIDTIVIAAHHKRAISHSRIERDIKEKVIKEVIPTELMDDKTKILINTTGRFVVGGPVGDSGLTGRKIIVDTYGGYAKHGGGAFSGKSPTKVDRTGSYAMRYLAKNIVASGAAKKCEIQVAYAIGICDPVSLCVDTFGTGKFSSDRELERIIMENVNLCPGEIIKRFDLRRPIYKQTASYGHFGRNDLELPWERLDIVDLFL
jgi:S-adenosylmethionine synthetase